MIPFKKLTITMICFIVLHIVPQPVNPAGSQSSYNQQSQRMIAVQLFELPYKTKDDFKSLFQRLKSDGVNTVIMRLFQNAGLRKANDKSKIRAGVFFKSSIAPVVNDLLSPACQASKETGVAIVGWMTTRNCDWFVQSHPEWQDERYSLEKRKNEYYPRLDIFHPAFHDALDGLFRELMYYDLAGILVQDDLILRFNEGLSMHARKAYFKDTGRSIKPDHLYVKTFRSNDKTYVSQYSDEFYNWREWKIERLMVFLNSLITSCKELKPNLRFALNFYYEALTSPNQAKTWYSHDLKKAINSKIDIFSFMAYQRQMSKELSKNRTQISMMLENMSQSALQIISDPNRILMKIQTRDWETGKTINESEIKQAILSVTKKTPVSIALVPYSKYLFLSKLIYVIDKQPVQQR